MKVLALAAVAAALAAGAARPASAAAPTVDAHAYVIEDAATGEVLAVVEPARATSHRLDHKADDRAGRARAPQALRHRHRRPSRRRGGRGVDLSRSGRADLGERPVEGRAHPVCKRRGRRPRAVRGTELPGIRGADERQGRATRPPRHALRPPGRARRARRLLECRRRDEARADRDAHPCRSRRCPPGDSDDPGRAGTAHLGRPPRRVPARVRREDRHTGEAGWCQVGAVHGRGRHDLRDDPREPVARRPQRGPGVAPDLWLAQFRVVTAIEPSRSTRRRSAVRPGGGSARPAKALRAVARVGRPFVERVSARRVASLPVKAGEVLGHVQVWRGGKLVGTRDLVATRAVSRPGLAGRVRWYAGRTVHHIRRFFASL